MVWWMWPCLGRDGGALHLSFGRPKAKSTCADGEVRTPGYVLWWWFVGVIIQGRKNKLLLLLYSCGYWIRSAEEILCFCQLSIPVHLS